MKELIVSKKYNNKKLISYLRSEFPMLCEGVIYKALRKKDIRVNNVKVSENIVLSENDVVTIYIVDELLYGKPPSVEIIYEDDNIIVVKKPKNLEVVGDNSLTSLIQKIKNTPSIMPCHRLDRNTKGLILFAKNQESLNILAEKFKNHEIKKYYKCIVIGLFKKKHDILNAYLFKDNKKSLVYISEEKKPGYRPIKTEYTVLEENKNENYSILEVILHTGRTHQIRAHLAHVGHPIIGDGKYGRNEINKKFGKNTQSLVAYKMIFDFKTDSGILEYLNNKNISL